MRSYPGIPEIIRGLRESAHMTQQQLANALNIAVSSVARYEQGASRPDAEILRAMIQFARDNQQEDWATLLEIRLFVLLGIAFPMRTIWSDQELCLELAQKISENPFRVEEFLKFAAPEYQSLKREQKKERAALQADVEEMEAIEKHRKTKAKKGKKA